MNVKRALQVLPPGVVLTAEARTNYYGSAWVVWATFPDGDRRPVTQFASTDVFGAAHWIADFNRKAAARRPVLR